MPSDTDIRLAGSDRVVPRHGSDSSRAAAAPTDDTAERLLRMQSTVAAPRRARSLVVDSLAQWDRDDLLDPAILVVSELVANAVRYGGADLTVALARDHDGVRIAVGDTGPADPTMPEVDRRALGGRGVRLIAALASDWGYRHKDSGKIVWAIIDEDRLHGPNGTGRSAPAPATPPR
ncbi:MAG TPA: ATP-binding protein [Acidimicrobiia bacterium]|jgi:anti-sigma regulatory factor (Ser/Thr protein kinase)